MYSSHGHQTRSTTKIQHTIDELAAQLPQRTRMINSDETEGTANGAESVPIQVTSHQLDSLLRELANLREEINRLQVQQGRNEISTTDSNTTKVQVIVNTDPLQQMKDFVKPFYGNPDEDVYKWLESIVHYFNVARLPGIQEQLYFQYASAFLKDYAYTVAPKIIHTGVLPIFLFLTKHCGLSLW